MRQAAPRISVALAGSAAVHLLAVGALVLLALATPRVTPPPKAYVVSLVELPPPEPPPPEPAPRPEPPRSIPKPPPPAMPKPVVPPKPPAAAIPDPFARALPTIAARPSPTPAAAAATPTATPSADQLRRLALAGREARMAPAPTRSAPRVAVSAPIRTDGPPFPYPHYLSLLSDRISANWFPPPGAQAGPKAVLRFRIMRDGTVGDLMIETSSGSDAVDRSALRAVLAASPLPPLPEGFTWESLGVHFGFDLSSR